MDAGISQETCPLCNGAGWVRRDVPVGHPDFGQAFPCRCQKEGREQEAWKRLLVYSNLGPLVRLTFDNFIPTGRSSDPAHQALTRGAFEACREFAEKPEGWLVLTGPSGCGKTHLAAAIANQCIQGNRPALFMGVPDLLDHLRAAFAPTSEIGFDVLFEQVRNAPLLIMDDFGVQSGTPWAQEKLFQLLNHRFTTRLPTVVTTSTPLEGLDERLKTRLTEPGLSKVLALEKMAMARVGERDALEEEHLGETFEAFKVDRPGIRPEERDNLEHVYRAALEYARNPDGWLVFIGRTGCGKTHLAAAIANYRRRQGDEVLFTKVSDLLGYLRDKFSPESRISHYEAFERVKRVQLLVLDDFRKHASSAWAEEKLYQIIDYRYNTRLPTVITCNSSLELGVGEDYIVSRLADPRVCNAFEIIVPDYRDVGRPGVRPKGDEPERRGRRGR